MIRVADIRYKPIAILEDGAQLDLSGAVTELGWEEGENELATRISFTAANDADRQNPLSQRIKPGCMIVVMADWGEGFQEVARAAVVEWEPSRSTAANTLRITAYDELFWFEKSQDNRYIAAGTGTKSALTEMFNEWGIPVDIYNGPDIAHEKTLYKGQTIGKMVLDLLDTAKKQGGPRCFIRATRSKVNILPFGINTEVYHFDEDTNLTIATDKLSVKDLITRVKIVGKADDEGRTPVEAVMDGHTEFGIRQQIVNHNQDASLEEAQKEAQDILDEDGEPKREITLESQDVPLLRKGDKIHVNGLFLNGYFYVISIRHNATKGTMTLGVEPVE